MIPEHSLYTLIPLWYGFMCFSNIKPGISLITYPNQQQPIKKKKSNYVKEMTEGQDSLREGMNL